MSLTRAQVEQLLRPINPDRVLRDGKGHSHVSQQDIAAHLIRVFGFGGFDTDVLSVECVFETERTDQKTSKPSGRWDCCYRAMVRLTIRDPDGNEVCHYEDGSTALAQNQTRGDAHDLAYKSAISLSKKRAAINLGDQFGLSLYNKGQLAALVRGTLVIPDGEEAGEDLQEGVPRQVAMGNDEVDRDPSAEPAGLAGEDATQRHVALIKVALDRPEIVQTLRKAREAGADMHVIGQAAEARQKILDAGPPKNQDGSVSRSRMTDEERTAAGIPTRAEVRADSKATKELWATGDTGKKAERSNSVDENDQWATGAGA